MLKIKRLTSDAVIPRRAHKEDAGLDIYANEDIIISPGETVAIKTGIAIQLPPNTMGAIDPRSGITAKTKLRVIHGTIDEGYTGEIKVIADNISPDNDLENFIVDINSKSKLSNIAYRIRKGDKIAQLVIIPIVKPEIEIVADLDDSERGEDGFGSTGI